MLDICILHPTGTEPPKSTGPPSKVIAGWCYSDPTQWAWPSVYLSPDSQHSLQLSRSYSWVLRPVTVQEINLIAYPPLFQPSDNPHLTWIRNPGRCRLSASQAQQTLWLTKHISPLSHRDRRVTHMKTAKLMGQADNKNCVLYPRQLRWWNNFLLCHMCQSTDGTYTLL